MIRYDLKLAHLESVSFMSDFIGWFSILLILFLTLIICLRWPGVAKIICVAFIVRVAVILFGIYIAPLPDSDGDAIGFEMKAWELSQSGFRSVILNFKGPNTYFLSWVIAILYSITERSLLLAQSISLFFGIGSVFLGWLLIRKVWGDSAARKAGWVLALFPSLILYSVLVLRETYTVFFLFVALHGVVDWSRSNNIKPFLLAMGGFIGATFFHGAMIIGGGVFLLIVILTIIKNSIKSLFKRGSINLQSIVLIGFIGATILFYDLGSVNFPKLGTFNNAINIENLLKMITANTLHPDGDSGASYPNWTNPNSIIELIYKAPIKVTYFIFSPFPWDIRKNIQFIGLFDSLLYMTLVFFTWKNRKAIWTDRASRNILFVLLAYLFVFGLVVGNFGTAIRHRSKFVGALILLAAPKLPKLIFFKKKK